MNMYPTRRTASAARKTLTGSRSTGRRASNASDASRASFAPAMPVGRAAGGLRDFAIREMLAAGEACHHPEVGLEPWVVTQAECLCSVGVGQRSNRGPHVFAGHPPSVQIALAARIPAPVLGDVAVHDP